MARAAPVAGISPEQRSGEAVAQVLEVRSGELAAHARALGREPSGEALHDVRVDLRRLRSLLEAFAPCFPERARRRVVEELKELSAALGVRRDREVLEELLARHLAQSPAPSRSALAGLRASVQEQRAGEQQQLADAVARLQSGRLDRQLEKLAERAREPR